MVGAVSSSTSAAVTLTSSSGGSGLSALEAQLSAKESELSEAQDEDAKAELKDAIATLKAEIAALKAAKETSSPQQQAAQASGSEDTSRIGTRNFEDGDPFGEREMYV
ncbi:hypothetical protein MUO32_00625 [Shinella sp. CPCC 101442]|uniref:hypothetical protein n=1 Tax=Shinella sp. CPCC 101442 TaxID=2932265 RepID=UPI002152A8E2|nr:hypothetical protein [Shinella sp. CPCC 101442]MCR6497525.1 hypothetical protein [Shinella sp. CPCC 101442]